MSKVSPENSVIPTVSHIVLAKQQIPRPMECVWIIMAFTHMRILPQGKRRTAAAGTESPKIPFRTGRSGKGKKEIREGVSNK